MWRRMGGSGRRVKPQGRSDVELEQQHVAVLDHVFLAFLTQLSRFARSGLTAQRHIVGKGGGFGADKALFKISMDLASGEEVRTLQEMLTRQGEEIESLKARLAALEGKKPAPSRAAPASKRKAASKKASS